jgi:hypothetical protein
MPLNIEYAAVAQCRPEHVWQVFEHVELWPRWDPQAIREVSWVSGEPWTRGAKFAIQLLKPMSFTLTPEVLEVEAPIYVHLRGDGSGVTGEQYYIFRWMPDQQTTELRTLQEFSGGPIIFLGNSIKPSIEAGIKHLFARVIEEAEGLARAEASVPLAPELPAIEHLLPPSELTLLLGDSAPAEDTVPLAGDPLPPTGDSLPPIGDPAPPDRE